MKVKSQSQPAPGSLGSAPSSVGVTEARGRLTALRPFFRFCRNRALLLFFAVTARCWRAMRQTLNPVLAKVLKRLHYPLNVILLCVRWYSAYPLSLRNLEEMMAERGISVDHSTVHRWAIKLLPGL